MTIHTRALGACLACAVSIGTLAQAGTNWDSLKSSDWSGNQGESQPDSGQAASGRGGQSAQGANVTQSSGGTGIKQAFVKLGMAEQRAACYQDVLSQKLSPDQQEQAAQIVSESTDSDEVRTNVVSAGPTIMGGFSAADAQCPEGMGS